MYIRHVLCLYYIIVYNMVHTPLAYYARVQYRLCRRRRAARTSRTPVKLDIFGPLRTIGIVARVGWP